MFLSNFRRSKKDKTSDKGSRPALAFAKCSTRPYGVSLTQAIHSPTRLRESRECIAPLMARSTRVIQVFLTTMWRSFNTRALLSGFTPASMTAKPSSWSAARAMRLSTTMLSSAIHRSRRKAEKQGSSVEASLHFYCLQTRSLKSQNHPRVLCQKCKH